jgi:hypothetical protein
MPTHDRPRAATLACWLVFFVHVFLALLVSSQTATPRRQAVVIPTEAEQSTTTEPMPLSADDRFRAAMLGVWEDDYQGHRVLTLADDGTGVMVVEPVGLASFTYAPQLTFTEKWSVTDGTVRMDATGGQPAIAVQMILKLYGSSATFRIEDVTSERMILIDLADKTRFEWRRVEDAK